MINNYMCTGVFVLKPVEYSFVDDDADADDDPGLNSSKSIKYNQINVLIGRGVQI